MNTNNKIQIICLNPFCSKQNQRCMDGVLLQKHPNTCSQHYYLAQTIKNKPWGSIPNYPNDNLGNSNQLFIQKGTIWKSVKLKHKLTSTKSFLSSSIQQLKQSISLQLDKLQSSLMQLYPLQQLEQYYFSVYDLDKVSQCLNNNNNSLSSSVYINKLINNNLMRPKYQALMVLNQNYDDVKIMIENLENIMKKQIQLVVKKHLNSQGKTNKCMNINFNTINNNNNDNNNNHNNNNNNDNNNKMYNTRLNSLSRCRIQYDLIKSKFIHSSEIAFINNQIHFPRIKNIASFLPWIYGQRSFSSQIHQLKISNTKYPILQNAGFTILQDQDIDTYPYMYYKSLFSQQGNFNLKLFLFIYRYLIYLQILIQVSHLFINNIHKGRGFKLIKGDPVETYINKSTVMILRLQLDQQKRALIYDSEMRGIYQCILKDNPKYRLGIYGTGWNVMLIGLN